MSPKQHRDVRALSITGDDFMDIDNDMDILDKIISEGEIKTKGPAINSKLADCLNKTLKDTDLFSNDFKNKMENVKIPENLNTSPFGVPNINEELLEKHIGLDRFGKRNDHRIKSIQNIISKASLNLVESTNNTYECMSTENLKSTLNESIKKQTETINMLTQVNRELSKLRRAQLYQHFPKEIRGICFSKVEKDDELLFGENLKEALKETRTDHYKNQKAPFLGKGQWKTKTENTRERGLRLTTINISKTTNQKEEDSGDNRF